MVFSQDLKPLDRPHMLRQIRISFSSSATGPTDVPQRSLIDPLSLIVYANDLPCAPNIQFLFFTHDVELVASINARALSVMWDLPLNLKTRHHLHISSTASSSASDDKDASIVRFSDVYERSRTWNVSKGWPGLKFLRTNNVPLCVRRQHTDHYIPHWQTGSCTLPQFTHQWYNYSSHGCHLCGGASLPI